MYRNLSIEDIDGEIWKPVVGYENDYMVSNYGRVKSIFTSTIDYRGFVFSHKPKILKQGFTTTGYLCVSLRGQKYRVHRLVGFAFIPLREGAENINHKDCNPLNNRVENLEWCTHLENVHYAISLKRYNYSYVDKEKVVELYKQGYTGTQIGEMLSISKRIVGHIAFEKRLSRKEYPMRSRYFEIVDENTLRDLLKNGARNCEIVKKYNVPNYFVSWMRKKIKKENNNAT